MTAIFSRHSSNKTFLTNNSCTLELSTNNCAAVDEYSSSSPRPPRLNTGCLENRAIYPTGIKTTLRGEKKRKNAGNAIIPSSGDIFAAADPEIPLREWIKWAKRFDELAQSGSCSFQAELHAGLAVRAMERTMPPTLSANFTTTPRGARLLRRSGVTSAAN